MPDKTKNFSTHVIFISGQAVPNVTPVMDDEFRPGKIVLCTSNAMKGRGEMLAKFFDSKGIKTEIAPLGDAYDLNELQERMLEIAGCFEKPGEVGINLTGGTKLMTIAAQMVFRDNGFTCFYVIPERDQLLLLDSHITEPRNLTNKIRLDDYLEIHGYTVKSIKRPQLGKGRHALFASFREQYSLFEKRVGTLNYLASKSEETSSLKVKEEVPEKVWPLLDLFCRIGAISYYDDRKIEFESESSRDYCKGLWLEEYAYWHLEQISLETGIQDIACSIEIETASHIPNEIDVAFLHENNLYIVECKTSDMGATGTNAIYKLDTIKGYMGLCSKSVIVSLKPLAPYDKRRAEELKIKTLEGAALKNLGKHFMSMMRPGER